MFPVEKDEFFAVSSWGRMVFEIYAYPFGYFWRCKIDEILTVILHLVCDAMMHVLKDFINLKYSELLTEEISKSN